MSLTKAGVGNGSTFRMIPAIFRSLPQRLGSLGADHSADALVDARRNAAAVIGICSAIGALGGFFIPLVLGKSIKATGGPATAFGFFVGAYVLCVAVTWFCYRRSALLKNV